RFQTMREMARAIHGAVPSEHRRIALLGPPPLPFAVPGAAVADPRRRMPRAPYITPVSLLLKGGSIDGRTEDISEGGMLVIIRQPCLPGQVATVRFAAPMDGKVVNCEACIRWVRVARSDAADGARAVGLEFVQAPPEVRSSIARYVTAMGGEISAVAQG
ncbi:MAG: PilZ domain-containing protein, partial [Polyangiaceae bacterium]